MHNYASLASTSGSYDVYNNVNAPPSDNQISASMPNVLTFPGHIGYHHPWSLLLLLSPIMAAGILCGWNRSIANQVGRKTVLA